MNGFGLFLLLILMSIVANSAFNFIKNQFFYLVDEELREKEKKRNWLENFFERSGPNQEPQLSYASISCFLFKVLIWFVILGITLAAITLFKSL